MAIDILIEGRAMDVPHLTLSANAATQSIELKNTLTLEREFADLLDLAAAPDPTGSFVAEAALVLASQWGPAFKCFPKPEFDSAWGWLGMWGERLKHGRPNEFAVITMSGVVQGALLCGPLKEANLPPSLSGNRVLYVANMATAPWNRRGFQRRADVEVVQSGPFKGVGTALIKYAVERSQKYGCNGRLGLRAMGASYRFYRRLGFQCLGKHVKDDEFRGHSWWELATEDALKVLSS